MVESDTARVSVLPVVGSELPAVCVGNGALDLVDLRVGPSCIRMDSEETLPDFQVERSVMSFFGSGRCPGGRPMEWVPVLEPLEHSVLEMALDSRPMEGRPVLEPLEHSVLEMAQNGGPLEEMSNLEPLEHSVLNVALDGRPMEGIPVLEPLEHSVLELALDSRLMEGMTVLEPLEHSVLKEARSDGPTVGMSVLEPLEHSVPDVTLDWGDHSLIKMAVSDPLEHSGLGETDDVRPGLVPPEPLEHSVLVTARVEGDVSVAGVTKLDPIEHSGAMRRMEMISAYLPRVAGRHVAVGPSGTVDGGWRTEAWFRCSARRPGAGSGSSASGRKY